MLVFVFNYVTFFFLKKSDLIDLFLSNSRLANLYYILPSHFNCIHSALLYRLALIASSVQMHTLSMVRSIPHFLDPIVVTRSILATSHGSSSSVPDCTLAKKIVSSASLCVCVCVCDRVSFLDDLNYSVAEHNTQSFLSVLFFSFFFFFFFFFFITYTLNLTTIRFPNQAFS